VKVTKSAEQRLRLSLSQKRRRQCEIHRKLTPKMRYAKYLHSEHWLSFRLGIIAQRGPACEVCGNKQERPALHHLSYARVGAELESDVVIVCDGCHRSYHDLPSLDTLREDFLINGPAVRPVKTKKKKAPKLPRIHTHTRAQILALRTPKGGFTKESVQLLGVSWPPPKGWLKARLERCYY
jgi:hypothetical protein